MLPTAQLRALVMVSCLFLLKESSGFLYEKSAPHAEVVNKNPPHPAKVESQSGSAKPQHWNGSVVRKPTGAAANYLGKRCLDESDCHSEFIKGLTCDSDGDGVPGNCTCPELTPLFLEQGGVYRCIKAGVLGSSCERMEQCRYSNVYLICLGGKCVCPAPLRIKQGIKCMPDNRLGDNCTSIDSCFTRFSVCVHGTCVCRIHYERRNNSCVYVGDTSWKVRVAFIFPGVVVLFMSSVVILAFCNMVIQRYQIEPWGGNLEDDVKNSAAADPSNDAPTEAYTGAFISGNDGRAGLTASGASELSPRAGFRLGQEDAFMMKPMDGAPSSSPLTGSLQLTTGGSSNAEGGVRHRRRRVSFPGGGNSSGPHTVDLSSDVLARLMASLERRMSAHKSVLGVAATSLADNLPSDGGVEQIQGGNHTPVGIPLGATHSGTGYASPRSIIKKFRSVSNPAVVPLDEPRVRKVVRIGSQEISSTVTYVPYDAENYSGVALEWPTLREDVLQERFPNLAALSEASITDALRAVSAAQKEKAPEPRDSKQRNGRPSVEEELSGLGNDDMLLGIGLTPDFMETSNPESFRMPQLKSDELPLRFPQLAQLDLPAFRDGN